MSHFLTGFRTSRVAVLLRRLRAGRLSLSFAERTALLHTLDLVAVNAALYISLVLRPQHRLSLRVIYVHPIWFLTLTAVWLLASHAFDAYEPHVSGRFPSSSLSAAKAGAATALIYLLIPYLTPTLPPRRVLLLAFFTLMVALPAIERRLYTWLFSGPGFVQRTLIVGAGHAGRTVAEAVLSQGGGFYHVVGFVDDAPEKQGTSVVVQGHRLPILGNRDMLRDLIGHYEIDTLVLAITYEIDALLLEKLFDCLELGVEIVPMPLMYERLTGRVPIQHVGDNWYVAMPIRHPLTHQLNRVLKRISDILLSLAGMIVFAPFVPLVALAIYVDSPGPIFYTQERVGKGGRIFKVYKFRSMVPDAERYGPVWAQENDPRVTRVGRVLRKMHIDEFPQFLNVLKGEMSVVGPRPERPEFVEDLAREIPFYRVRHAVKPGMAGWALVKYGYAASKMDAMIKLEYDLYYIKHWSLWFDAIILIKTFLDMLTWGGRA